MLIIKGATPPRVESALYALRSGEGSREHIHEVQQSLQLSTVRATSQVNPPSDGGYFDPVVFEEGGGVATLFHCPHCQDPDSYQVTYPECRL